MLFESQIHDLICMLPWVASRHAKQQMRNIDSQKRRILVPEQVEDASKKVVARLEQMQHFKDAKVVMLYYPVHNEIDLLPLVRKYGKEKKFLFPAITHHSHKMEVREYTHHAAFLKGRYGIPELQSGTYDGDIDLIITPGMSFDKRHWRVGRGGGYYDRFLRRYSEVFSIGVCYDFQLHEKAPHWIFDIRVGRVVTPTQTI